jgi:acetyltransferase-like isoleucine patch superfamily enzyme
MTAAERPGNVPTPVIRPDARTSGSWLRGRLKATARGVAAIAVLPFYLSYLARRALFGEQAFRSSSQQLSRIPGFCGDYLRGQFYRLTLSAYGRDVQIAFGTLFSTPMASIGDDVYVGSNCMVGNVTIGRDVLLGSNVHLLSGQAQHGIDDLTRPIRLQARHSTQISIGDDSWIGNAAVVMANVGRQCVIGAGSVVVSDIPDRSIAAGNPARVLRSRS